MGTRLEIDAKAAKPLQTAVLCLEDGREFPGRLSTDGLRIAFNDAGLVVEKSGSYWFRLTDREGLTGGQDDRWEIVARCRLTAQRDNRATGRQFVRHSPGRCAAARHG